MAETRTYRIRKAFLLPLGLLLGLCLVLLALCIVQDEPVGKTVILGCLILPVAAIFAESVSRRTVIGSDAVRMHKLLREKELPLAEITAVETVMVRKRAFVTVCAEDEFLIFSNAYADFPGLVGTLLSRVADSAISEETREMAKAPPVKSSDIVSCWLAVALLVLIIYGQLGPHL